MAEESKVILAAIEALHAKVDAATPPKSTWDALEKAIEAPAPMREKEVSLLGLDSLAPAPVKWFSKFMIWQHPDPAVRKEAVNTLVRRTMQVLSLSTTLLVIYLTSLMGRLESKINHPVVRTVTIQVDSADAGADQ